MKAKHKFLILILMGMFLAIMFNLSEARAEKLTANLVMHSDDPESSIIRAAAADRLSKLGVRQDDDSDCIVHMVYFLAEPVITCGTRKKSLRIMFIGGVFMKRYVVEISGIKFMQQKAVNSFKGGFYWDKEHAEDGFDVLVKALYTGILEVYAGVK